MDVIVTSVDGVIKVGVLSQSLLNEEDSHKALDKIKRWESDYIKFIKDGKEIIRNDNGRLENKWKLADLIYRFLNKNKEIRFNEYDKSISRDLGLVPTEKRKVGPATSDVNALIGLRKTFGNPNELDTRFSWELLYYVYPIIMSDIKKKNQSSFKLGNERLINDIINIANNEAKFAIKGNSGHAAALIKKLVKVLLSSS